MTFAGGRRGDLVGQCRNFFPSLTDKQVSWITVSTIYTLYSIYTDP